MTTNTETNPMDAARAAEAAQRANAAARWRAAAREAERVAEAYESGEPEPTIGPARRACVDATLVSMTHSQCLADLCTARAAQEKEG